MGKYIRERQLEYNKQWRAKNPEKAKAQRARYYEKHRDEIHPPRAGVCAICKREEKAMARTATGRTRRLAQDHCHATGILRGFLCMECNRGLGAFEDDPERLAAAAAYVLHYRNIAAPILLGAKENG